MEQIEKYFIYNTQEQCIVYGYDGFSELKHLQEVLANYFTPQDLEKLIVCRLVPYATVVPPAKGVTLNVITNDVSQQYKQPSEKSPNWREEMRAKYNIPSGAEIYTSTFWMYRDFPEAEVIYSVHTPGGYLDRECWNYYNEKRELLKSETGGYC